MHRKGNVSVNSLVLAGLVDDRHGEPVIHFIVGERGSPGIVCARGWTPNGGPIVVQHDLVVDGMALRFGAILFLRTAMIDDDDLVDLFILN